MSICYQKKIEKGIGGRICHSNSYSKANNKYMKDYDDKNKESSYL